MDVEVDVLRSYLPTGFGAGVAAHDGPLTTLKGLPEQGQPAHCESGISLMATRPDPTHPGGGNVDRRKQAATRSTMRNLR